MFLARCQNLFISFCELKKMLSLSVREFSPNHFSAIRSSRAYHAYKESVPSYFNDGHLMLRSSSEREKQNVSCSLRNSIHLSLHSGRSLTIFMIRHSLCLPPFMLPSICIDQ